ncbi:hypothetical protein TrCOL_g13755 [Triparma columacea]|uniref:Uncharacterized protein n=2 Tax=Triparma columacea TaxID=722753 RepID=A0A9W7GD08_9STRA|nr:hypothetical protein TrCOL_g13755 [Triparma columacea]
MSSFTSTHLPYYSNPPTSVTTPFTNLQNHLRSLVHNMIKLELSIKSSAPLTSVLQHLKTNELPAISAHAEALRKSNNYVSLHLLDKVTATVGKIKSMLNNINISDLETIDKTSPISFHYIKILCYHESTKFEDKEWKDLNVRVACSNGVWTVRGVYECVKDIKSSVDEMWIPSSPLTAGIQGLKRDVMGDQEYYERTGEDSFYEDLESEDEGKRREAERIADSYAETDGKVVVTVLGMVMVMRESLKAGVVKIKEIGGKIDKGEGDEETIRAWGERLKEGEKLAGGVRDKAGDAVVQCYPQMLEVDEDGGLVKAVNEVETIMEMWWEWGGMKGARGMWKEKKAKWEEAMKTAREVQEQYS